MWRGTRNSIGMGQCCRHNLGRGARMKKYYVYLDESGDFETDLVQGNKKNASLVGGFFWRRDDIRDIKRLKNKIDEIKSGENHATEMSGANKGEKVYAMLTGVKKFPIEFIIFQNDIKKKIVNSTQTYLTVVTEGLVQLMKKLVILENEPVEINVVVGFKKDTTQPISNSPVEGYIPIEDYTTRLIEKISVERAKLKNGSFQKSVINISLSDDKRDSYLILCDYICNFWYTRQSRVFCGSVAGSEKISIRNALESLYESDFIFPLFNTEENEHVLRMVQDGFYADALFEAFAGMISEKNYRLVKQSFLQLRSKQIHRQLDTLADYIGDLVIFRQPEKMTEHVLEEAEKLFEYLLENSIYDLKFYLDINLYLLAFFNNNGQIERMEQIFKKIEPQVARYTMRTLDVDYLLIYYTRWAVYLQDHHRYQESRSVCENMELLLELIKEAIRGNDCIRLEGITKSEQLGKVLGTKLQAQIPLCFLGQENYEAARDSSDRAMEQFTYEYDLIRQYQYRSELEAVCGNQEEALKWLEKSFGDKAWKEYIAGAERTIFDIYNLLYLAAFTKEVNPTVCADIAKQIYHVCGSELSKDSSLSKKCYLFMGWSLLGDKKLDGRGRAILNKLIEKESDYCSTESLVAREMLSGRNGLYILFRAR